LILPLLLILSVGFISYRVTHALFSDTAQSTDNTFSAASIFPGSSGSVVINEIMWMGSQGNSADEWIELRNMTSSTIDLSNWTVVNLGTGAGGTITIPSGKSIGPNGFFIISNDDNDPQSTSIMSVSPDHFDSSVSLLNPGEQLILKHSNTTTIDTADNDGGGWFAGEDPPGQDPKKSMARKDPPGDGTIADNWFTSTTSANLDPTASESATPKAANSL
jgi:hypothetical protein